MAQEILQRNVAACVYAEGSNPEGVLSGNDQSSASRCYGSVGTRDRDHFGEERLDLAGPLLANLFRSCSGN